MDKLYKITNDSVEIIESSTFEDEKELQNLTIKYPEILDLLTESEINPILIRDEIRISSGRLDNFLVDTEATPILIEVKERNNDELRRKVAGQLLDYASTISSDLIDIDFEKEVLNSCDKYGFEKEKVIENLYSLYEKEEFWDIFKKNLQHNRFKLVTLADKFFPSTERIINYLNEETINTVFIGLELMKFSVNEKTLVVPKLIGTPYFSSNIKRSLRSLNDESVFLEQIKSNKASSTLDQIDRVDQWADDKGLHFRFNDGKTAAKQYRLENEKNTLLCSATSKGEISLRLGELNKVLSTKEYEEFFTFLTDTFGDDIFGKANKKEAGPQFASILLNNITNSDLESLLNKFQDTFKF